MSILHQEQLGLGPLLRLPSTSTIQVADHNKRRLGKAVYKFPQVTDVEQRHRENNSMSTLQHEWAVAGMAPTPTEGKITC